MTAVRRLQDLNFSEYEAKAYIALVQSSPATGYQVSKDSGVPRSMVYEVLNKLVARGAAVSSPAERTTLYAPVRPDELLDRLRHEFEVQLDAARHALAALSESRQMDYVWNIEGSENILAKARDMIDGAEGQVHVGMLPETLPALRDSLLRAVGRSVDVIINTTAPISLPDVRVVVTPLVLDDVGQLGVSGSLGEFGWAGAAKTYYWVDPAEELAAVLMTQFMIGFDLPEYDFRALVYQAIDD